MPIAVPVVEVVGMESLVTMSLRIDVQDESESSGDPPVGSNPRGARHARLTGMTGLSAVWRSDSWRADADAWVRQECDRLGLAIVGDTDQARVRFWSTQLTVPTSTGQLWFKANNPDQAFEAALVDELSRIDPDRVVAPLAVDVTRGWMLSPDHGPTLLDRPDTDRAVWARVVADFADLQRRVAPHGDALIATGLSPLEPGDLPAFVLDVVDEGAARPAADPRHVDEELSARVRRVLPTVERWAEELAAGPVPLSLEHNDLHLNNAFAPHPDETSLRFFDFGDAVWAHPFTSLNVPLEMAMGEWETDARSPDIRYVVDAYLERWSDLAQPAELRRLADIAFAPRRGASAGVVATRSAACR